MTRITINPAAGTLEKMQGRAFWKKQKRIDLAPFERVRLSKTAVVVQDGYGAMIYSIVLEGPGCIQEVLATYDEQYARGLHDQLAELLALRQLS